MKWCIAFLFLVTLAAALPHDQSRTPQAKRVVTHRRGPVTPAGTRIQPPVKAPVRRVQAVRVVPAKTVAHAKVPTPVRTVSAPFRTTPPKPAKFHSVPVAAPPFKTYPGIRTLTKAENDALQRQIQQWQIAVVGGQVQPGYPGAPQPPPAPAPAPGTGYPAYPAGPGTIWIQVPSGAYPYPPQFPQAPAPPPPTAPVAPPAPAPEAPPVPEEPAAEEAAEGEDPVEETPAGEEIPATGEPPAPEAPPAAEEGVAPQEEVPAAPEEVPAVPEEVPATPEEVPATPEEVPATPEEIPATPEEVPATPEEPASGAEEGAAPEAPPAEGGETGEAGPSPPATGGGGDEQENKLVHCKEARGQFAHESSCSKYYNCWDDVVVEASCPNGLVFSEEHSYCDFPENVDCGQRGTEDVPPPIEGQEGCSSAYGSYRSQTNCSEFFICDNGVPVMFACPSGLFYNDEIGVCDYPYRVDCVNPPAPEGPPAEGGAEGGAEAPAPETPAPAPEEQPSPPAEAPAPPAEAAIPDSLRGLPPSFLKAGSPCWHNNVYPLNNVCSRVAVCRSGTTSILACPKGMAYDAYKRRCLPYYRARC
ncbi:fibrous sheath CABYR-binding protein-like [Ischnura elegans]|uniref:fibrous sheath CABYR-binding protein-like n=1 Tax=Ischnura elegans TaxID=197161 RepID=UPI001ED88289|nr:fibrous sheath CABYR-binding protein-like [Ischnura elegans]